MRKMTKRLRIVALCLLIGFVALEWCCRSVLGLGDPPLSVAHPTIEYMLKPNGSYRRFGNSFKTNRYGMRSADMLPRKSGPEIRILVLGDSVPNGGGLTDQDELATEIIKRTLAGKLAVPVAVGNISSGSWSPPNLLAYIREYGTFEADVAVVVLNRGDLNDFPTFEPLNPNTHPTRRPFTASGEFLVRYCWERGVRALGARDHLSGVSAVEDTEPTCLPELSALVGELREQGCSTMILYHPTRDELDADGVFQPRQAFTILKSFCASHAIPFFSVAGRYGVAVREGRSLYRDT